MKAGDLVGPYHILDKVGEGGMGEVYRATDTNLGRQVAIKVLPESVAGNPDRLARFDREARTLAALNHPNIATIHGLERSDGVTALVMELVEGPTLADRIAEGPMPVDEALQISHQIAEALEAAHENGIVHRDLKPANVKVRPDGAVKVLDFGLAKALGPEGSSATADHTMSPTITTPAMPFDLRSGHHEQGRVVTQAGVILGTAAYMAPEQARGKTVDTRADIWAYGAVLYEMLSGRRAFDGEDAAEVLGAVVRLEPDLDALPPSVPARLRQVIRACLQKNVKQRIAHMQDVRLALDGAFETAGQPVGVGATTTATRPLWRRALPLVATTVVVAALAATAGRVMRPDEPHPITRFSYVLPEGRNFISTARAVVAIDPTGRRFAYNGSDGLFVHSLDVLEDRAVLNEPATTSALFFSPDGETVGYWDTAARQLRRVPVNGGTPLPLTTVNALWGANWAPDGTILYGQADGIWQVSENGGESRRVIATMAGELPAGPSRLPGGDWVLFTIARTRGNDRWDRADIVVESPSTGERRLLRTGGADARYVPTGHLVYAQGSVLYAMPFDVRRLQAGAPVPVVQGLRRAVNPGGNSGDAFYGFSSNGTFVYALGGTAESNTSTLTWVDSSDRRQPLDLPSGHYEHPRLSADGQWVAVERQEAGTTNIWLYETSGKTAARRLTEGGNNRYPVWSRDGASLVFQSDRDGDRAIFRQRADGNGGAEKVTTPPKGTDHIPEAWSPTEDRLAFSALSAGGAELWMWTFADGNASQVALSDPRFRSIPSSHGTGIGSRTPSARVARRERTCRK